MDLAKGSPVRGGSVSEAPDGFIYRFGLSYPSMTDPLASIPDPALRERLRRLRDQVGQIKTSRELQEEVPGFRGQKGIYKPAGSKYALWVRQTFRGPYADENPRILPDGSWVYPYSPEARGGRPDLELDTNAALLRCRDDGVPVGVFRQSPEAREGVSYEIMGLAYVEDFDGTHFRLRGEPIDWEEGFRAKASSVPFEPFERNPRILAPQLREQRDQRFRWAVRMAYHDRCSLCELGYRVRGVPLAVEAAHVIPVERRGTSRDIRNGILLCRNHHALFDEFTWTFDEDLSVVVAPDTNFRESAAQNCILKWEGKRLPNLPDSPEDLPGEEAIRFRMEQFESQWR